MKRLFVIFIVLSIFLCACAKNENDSIKIGVIMPLTGNLSWLGNMYKQQFEYIKYKLSKENKIDIDLFYKDSMGKAKNALTLYQDLKGKVAPDMYFTAMTPEGMAIAPQATKHKDILFAFSSDPKLPRIGESIFSISISADKQAQSIKEFILKNNYKRLGLLYLDSLAMKNEVESLKKILPKDVQIVFEDVYKMGPFPLKNQILKFKKSNADLLALFGYGIKFKEIVSTLKEQSVKISVIGNTAFNFVPIFVQDTKLFSNIYFTNLKLLRNTNLRKQLKDNYFKKFGHYPTLTPHAIALYEVFNFIIPMVSNNKKMLIDNELSKVINGKVFDTDKGRIFVDKHGMFEFDFFITKFDESGEITYEDES